MTRKEREKDVQEHPENHRHDFNGLISCSLTNGCIDQVLIEAHAKYVNLGVNGGIKCNVVKGACACGAWH